MDYLQEAKNKYNARPKQLAGANTAAAIATAEALQSIAVSLAALVELNTGGTMTDTVGDGDFTDEADAEMELPF